MYFKCWTCDNPMNEEAEIERYRPIIVKKELWINGATRLGEVYICQYCYDNKNPEAENE
jgi:hypothetical protein